MFASNNAKPVKRGLACLLMAAFFVCAMLFVNEHTAYATTWSATKTTIKDGATYTYNSGVDQGQHPTAYTRIKASKAPSKGTMKAKAQLVKGLEKRVVAASAWASNGVNATLTAKVTSSKAFVGVRSSGIVMIKGVKYQCNATAASRSLIQNLPENSKGQTFGSVADVEQGNPPELIAVVADNGLNGYVLYSQYESEEHHSAIPVFDKDCDALIGMFTFGDK